MKSRPSSRLAKRYAAMTEYIIILALVAIGSIAIFTLFGDQIRNIIGHSTKRLGGDADAVIDPVAVPATTSKNLSDF